MDNLCKNFNIKGKSSKYRPAYNHLSILNLNNPLHHKFIVYARQDSKDLFNAVSKAQILYYIFKIIMLILRQ